MKRRLETKGEGVVEVRLASGGEFAEKLVCLEMNGSPAHPWFGESLSILLTAEEALEVGRWLEDEGYEIQSRRYQPDPLETNPKDD